jgi:hypothetical protein
MATRTATILPAAQRYVQPAPTRGWLGHMLAVLLQPVAFFRQMPNTRQWLFVALLILVLVGAAAVRRPSAESGVSGGDVSAPPIFDPNAPAIDPSFGAPIDPSIPPVLPPDGQPAPGAGNGGSAIAETTITALVAASGVLLAWAIQTLVLAEVSLLNGKAPNLGRNMQIAVWASVPLALMALVQLVYFALGGTPAAGFSVLLRNWEGYTALPTMTQALLNSAQSHLTLFWLWSLLLFYTGARQALRGKGWACALAVVIWITLAILLPVLTGAVQPLEMATAQDAEVLPLPEVPFELDGGSESFEVIPGGEMQVIPGGAIQVMPGGG